MVGTRLRRASPSRRPRTQHRIRQVWEPTGCHSSFKWKIPRAWSPARALEILVLGWVLASVVGKQVLHHQWACRQTAGKERIVPPSLLLGPRRTPDTCTNIRSSHAIFLVVRPLIGLTRSPKPTLTALSLMLGQKFTSAHSRAQRETRPASTRPISSPQHLPVAGVWPLAATNPGGSSFPRLSTRLVASPDRTDIPPTDFLSLR